MRNGVNLSNWQESQGRMLGTLNNAYAFSKSYAARAREVMRSMTQEAVRRRRCSAAACIVSATILAAFASEGRMFLRSLTDQRTRSQTLQHAKQSHTPRHMDKEGNKHEQQRQRLATWCKRIACRRGTKANEGDRSSGVQQAVTIGMRFWALHRCYA